MSIASLNQSKLLVRVNLDAGCSVFQNPTFIDVYFRGLDLLRWYLLPCYNSGDWAALLHFLGPTPLKQTEQRLLRGLAHTHQGFIKSG